MDLNLVRLIFTLKLESDAADPYVLFGLKPFFMDAFRLAAGCMQPHCETCSRGGDCSFHLIFSQVLSTEPAALKRHQKPSYPFVFDIPVIPHLPNAGRTLELGLTLAGIAATRIEDFITAVGGMLATPGLKKRIDASLVTVESVGFDGGRTLIMAPDGEAECGQVITLSLRGLMETVVIPAETVMVTLLAPLRLMSEGRPLVDFSFPVFIRALMRRLSSLVYYYGEEATGLDFKWLASQSIAAETMSADFRWVDKGSKWSGLLGTGVLIGVVPEFHPFLLAGEYLHVGKGASFGLGAYRVNKTA